MGEKVRPWLQHMGALRPDLPIGAMVKIKMEPAEAEVMGTFNRQRLRHDSQSDER